RFAESTFGSAVVAWLLFPFLSVVLLPGPSRRLVRDGVSAAQHSHGQAASVHPHRSPALFAASGSICCRASIAASRANFALSLVASLREGTAARAAGPS